MRPDSAARAAAVATWWPWLALPAVAASLVTLGLSFDLDRDHPAYVQGEAWFLVPASVGFTIVAAGIWSTRPHPAGINRLGIVYSSVGLGCAVALPAYGWAQEDLPGSELVAWVSNWSWTLGPPVLMGLGLVLYPDGELPGRRWWPAPTLGLIGIAGLLVSGAFAPGPLGNKPSVDNPVGIGPTPLWDVVASGSFPVLLLATLLGVLALVVKFWRAPRGGDLRGQIGGFAVAAMVLAVAAALPEGVGPTQTLLALVAGSALPATVGYAVLRRRLLDQRAEVAGLRSRVSRLAESRRELVSDREDERAHLRRELHDGLGPSLAAIGLGLRQLETDPDPDAVRMLADEVQRAVGEVRRISAGLGPAGLDELGLAAAVEEALGALDRFGPAVSVDIGTLPDLPRAVEVATYRIVMEAATNAVRHAHASHVTVAIWYDGALRLRVSDDGEGMPAAVVPGVGTHAMAARAEELGGLAEITSDDRGTSVEARLPVDAP